MASEFVDTEAFKITLEVVEDFINFDFPGFLEKHCAETKPRIITWEMNIFLKLLNDQSKGIVNYYLLQIKEEIEENLKINKYIHIVSSKKQTEYCFIKTRSDNIKYKGYHFITSEVQICKNPAMIKIIFYCDEMVKYTIPKKSVQNEKLKNLDEMRKVTYLDQMKNLILTTFNILEKSKYSKYFAIVINNKTISNFLLIPETFFSNGLFFNFYDLENVELSIILILHWIALDHSFEVFNILCKTFNEITSKDEFREKLIKSFTSKQKALEKGKYYIEKISTYLKIMENMYKLPGLDYFETAKIKLRNLSIML